MMRFTKKTIFSIILAFTFVFSMPAVAVMTNADYGSIAYAESGIRYTKQFLTKSQKHIYNTYLAAIKKGKTNCTFDTKKYNVSMKNYVIAEYALWRDYPEYGYWKYFESDISQMKGKEVYKAKIKYDKNLKNKVSKYKEKVGKIIDTVNNECDTELEKAVFIHDYLCDLIEYKDETVKGTEYLYKQQTSIGALVYESCVCEGYAKSFQDLCRRAGLDVWVVDCFQLVDEENIDPRWNMLKYKGKHWAGHSINMVKIDGEWYYVDVTADDGSGDFWGADYNNYTYAFKSYEDISKTHYLRECALKWDGYEDVYIDFQNKIRPESAEESLAIIDEYDVEIDGPLNQAAQDKIVAALGKQYVVTDSWDDKEKYIRLVKIKYNGDQDICSWLLNDNWYLFNKAGMSGELWTADPTYINGIIYFGLMKTKVN